MDKILEIDREAFLFINSEIDLAWLEYFFVLIREPEFWIPLYVFIASYLLINYKVKGFYSLLIIALVFLICDQFSSHLLKPFFERIRPCNEEDLKTLINLRVRCGSGYSFTSSHATNHFGVAISIGILFQNSAKWVLMVLLSWALLISFAQVYVGVHYPLDVISGAILGLGIGYAITTYLNKYLRFSSR